MKKSRPGSARNSKSSSSCASCGASSSWSARPASRKRTRSVLSPLPASGRALLAGRRLCAGADGSLDSAAPEPPSAEIGGTRPPPAARSSTWNLPGRLSARFRGGFGGPAGQGCAGGVRHRAAARPQDRQPLRLRLSRCPAARPWRRRLRARLLSA